MSLAPEQRSSEDSRLPEGRPSVELLSAQLVAIDAWNAARRASDLAGAAAQLTREMRLDLTRRMEARRREQTALLRRADEQLRASGVVLAHRAPLRAVIAHRQSWVRDAVAARLVELGMSVVGSFDDGADAAGTTVVEQPDVLLVEDRLPTLSGVEVVARARQFSPVTVVGAQVMDGAAVASFTDAGARAVFTRRIPPREMAELLVSCLGSAEAEPLAVL